MKWRSFMLRGVKYSLDHLHDFTLSFTQPAKGENPERLYEVDAEFGLHCFTSGIGPGQAIDPELKYCDSRECRHFDVLRYELSKQLPGIVADLHQRKCFHSGKGNFFLVEMVSPHGKVEQYEIYFAVSRASGGNGRLKLFVQSAYIRTYGHQPHRKPIGFYILLYNIKEGKAIRIPK
ncbi:MAG TPA: hypothetical protein DF427_00225 [Moraxellaceae bacterium]|nr:hypothetical protein [Moraxellaceae bacterium]